MKKICFLLVLFLSVPAFAGNPVPLSTKTKVDKLTPNVNTKIINQKKSIKPIMPYIDTNNTTVFTSVEGNWMYKIVLLNRDTTDIPANTLEVVVLRKHSDGYTLMDTQPVTKVLPASGSGAVVMIGEFSRCCTHYEMEARIRLKGTTNNILDTKTILQSSWKTVHFDLQSLQIQYDQKKYVVNIHSVETQKLLMKAYARKTSSLSATPRLLTTKQLIAPGGTREYSGSCQGLQSGETLIIKLFRQTTCIEPEGEDSCSLSLIVKKYP